ncbi:MAG: OmpA family protein [Thioalkalivibrio sp.]
MEFDEPGQEDGGWTVGYLDVLLLLVTLFAALLAAAYVQIDELEDRFAKADTEPATVNLRTLLEPATPVVSWNRPSPDTIPAGPMDPAPTMPAVVPQIAPALLTQTNPVGSMADEAPAPRIEAVPAPILLEPPESPQIVPELKALGALVASQGEEQPLEILIEDHQVRLEVGNDILFPSGAAQLSAAGIDLLGEIYEVLAQEPLSIVVEGHTDNVPINTERFPSNWELSSLRATTVARQLIELGIPAEQMRIAGHAHTRPRVANDTPENRALNRRVSLVLEVPQ